MAFTAEQKRAARAAKREAAQAAKSAGKPTEVEKLNQAAIARPDLSGAPDVAQPSRSGAKVTVGLKLGVAYFDIQLCRMETKFQQNMQGGRDVREAVRVGLPVRLRGTAYPRGTVPAGFPDKPKIVAGAALNPGVDKDFWDAWVEQNRLNPLVVNGMIFAHAVEENVVAFAKETADVKSGLEPIDPNDKKDARIPKSTRSDLTNIETEDARAKKHAMLAGTS